MGRSSSYWGRSPARRRKKEAPMRRKLWFAVILCVALAVMIGIGAPIAAAALQFNVTIAPGVSATPLDGRLLVIVSTDYDGEYEPRLQASDGWVPWGPPF